VKRPPRTLGARTASDAVAAALALHGISEQVRAGRLLTEWSELVGSKIAQRTRPDAVIDRILWIEVASSAWLHELNLLRPQLLASLQGRLGMPPVFDELRFRLAGRRRAPGSEPDPRAARKPPPPPRSSPVAATGVARERIVREVGAVDDQELRELIARIRIAHDR